MTWRELQHDVATRPDLEGTLRARTRGGGVVGAIVVGAALKTLFGW